MPPKYDNAPYDYGYDWGLSIGKTVKSIIPQEGEIVTIGLAEECYSLGINPEKTLSKSEIQELYLARCHKLAEHRIPSLSDGASEDWLDGFRSSLFDVFEHEIHK